MEKEKLLDKIEDNVNRIQMEVDDPELLSMANITEDYLRDMITDGNDRAIKMIELSNEPVSEFVNAFIEVYGITSLGSLKCRSILKKVIRNYEE